MLSCAEQLALLVDQGTVGKQFSYNTKTGDSQNKDCSQIWGAGYRNPQPEFHDNSMPASRLLGVRCHQLLQRRLSDRPHSCL